jgi:hypothetical protein
MAPSVWDESNLLQATPDQRNTKAWAIANALSSIKARIAQDNANRIQEYNQQFSDYSANMLNHPELNIVPPVPALAEVIVFDEDGWPEAGPGDEHVCPIKVYTPPATMKPAKKTEDGGLMGAIAAEAANTGLPTIPNVPILEKSTDSFGHVWLRIA